MCILSDQFGSWFFKDNAGLGNLVLGDKAFCISKYFKFPNIRKAKVLYLHGYSRVQPVNAKCSSERSTTKCIGHGCFGEARRDCSDGLGGLGSLVLF